MAILKYEADHAFLKQNFRYWHVKPLLNQAADLIELCKDDLKEFNALDYSSTQFNLEIKALQNDINLEKERLELHERDLINSQEKQKFYTESESYFQTALNEGLKLYNYEANEGQGLAGWTKAGQNKGEILVQSVQRILEKTLNEKQIAWASSDKNHFQKNLLFRENLLKIKLELSTNKNALDFEFRKNLIFKRIQRNYVDAMNRVTVAKEGLKIIYNYEEIGPEFTNNIDENISEVSIWVSNTIEWLVAYSQLDQSFTRVVSLMSLLSETEKRMLLNTTDECTLNIKIPEIFFEGHDNIRLKGLSASLINDALNIPWSIEIGVPEKGIFIRDAQRYPVDQKQLPFCLLGRVENRKTFRNIEVCGLISLLNASPIGQLESEGARINEGGWTVKIIKPALSNESFQGIKDIIIELNLTGKPL